ncbi:hypothetical protein NDU88_001361 [Pleurodeles waltl]|uniref:Uncharacterized protein n=1 Tax=Pleurodeles waltl TaxID=8319 RepID=A0AAV7SZ89_PLEWA|nr:hypothetical protein NDU88_001361 [Pleurodeles waltl]
MIVRATRQTRCGDADALVPGGSRQDRLRCERGTGKDWRPSAAHRQRFGDLSRKVFESFRKWRKVDWVGWRCNTNGSSWPAVKKVGEPDRPGQANRRTEQVRTVAGRRRGENATTFLERRGLAQRVLQLEPQNWSWQGTQQHQVQSVSVRYQQ